MQTRIAAESSIQEHLLQLVLDFDDGVHRAIPRLVYSHGGRAYILWRQGPILHAVAFAWKREQPAAGQWANTLL